VEERGLGLDNGAIFVECVDQRFGEANADVVGRLGEDHEVGDDVDVREWLLLRRCLEFDDVLNDLANSCTEEHQRHIAFVEGIQEVGASISVKNMGFFNLFKNLSEIKTTNLN
jgi:hypothetical protein